MDRIIKDEFVLRPEYLPERIPHREDDLRALVSHFKGFFQTGEHSTALVLSGPVGSGKTMLAKKLLIIGQQISKRSGTLIKFCVTNGRVDRGPSLFAGKLLRCIGLNFPRRGYDPVELVNSFLEDLSSNRYSLFLIIDEVDAFIEFSGPDLLYLLLRSSESGGPPSSLLLVSKDGSFMMHLDPSLKSSLSTGTINLNGYSAEQLFDILKDRVDLAFSPGTVPDAVIWNVADLASKFGDARLAIDLLYRAGKLAEFEGREKVSTEEVKRAYEEICPPVDLSALRELNEKERMILKAIAESSDIGGITIKELRSRINGVSYTSLWMLAKMLEAKGLIEVKKEKKKRGWTYLLTTVIKPSFLLDLLRERG